MSTVDDRFVLPGIPPRTATTRLSGNGSPTLALPSPPTGTRATAPPGDRRVSRIAEERAPGAGLRFRDFRGEQIHLGRAAVCRYWRKDRGPNRRQIARVVVGKSGCDYAASGAENRIGLCWSGIRVVRSLAISSGLRRLMLGAPTATRRARDPEIYKFTHPVPPATITASASWAGTIERAFQPTASGRAMDGPRVNRRLKVELRMYRQIAKGMERRAHVAPGIGAQNPTDENCICDTVSTVAMCRTFSDGGSNCDRINPGPGYERREQQLFGGRRRHRSGHGRTPVGAAAANDEWLVHEDLRRQAKVRSDPELSPRTCTGMTPTRPPETGPARCARAFLCASAPPRAGSTAIHMLSHSTPPRAAA